MFLYSGFESVNSPSDIPKGVYRCECSIYVNSKKNQKVMLLEYSLGADPTPSVVEVVVSTNDRLVQFVDFVKMPDRAWRHSSGVKHDSLQGLLPSELRTCRFVERTIVVVENVV